VVGSLVALSLDVGSVELCSLIVSSGCSSMSLEQAPSAAAATSGQRRLLLLTLLGLDM
jgi:hypothetical protein